MKPFSTARATGVHDALHQISTAPDARFVAGGTNLIDLMKYGVEAPSRIVDITQLPLARIEETSDGGLRIGALARNSDMAAHPLIRTRYPLLSEAILAGAGRGPLDRGCRHECGGANGAALGPRCASDRGDARARLLRRGRGRAVRRAPHRGAA